MDWILEMNKMLSAFENQAMQSLGIIKLSFRSSGLPFESTFKEYFLRATNNRLSETFDRFENKSKLEDKLGESSDGKDGTEIAYTSNKSIWKATAERQQNISESAVQIDDSDDEEFTAGAVETEPIDDSTTIGSFSSLVEIESVMIATQNTIGAHNSNNGPSTADDLHGNNESIAHQSNANESYYTIDAEVGNDLNFAVELVESNDSIAMVENQNGSSGVDYDELNRLPVASIRMDETKIGVLAKRKSKVTQLNRKNPNKKRMTTTTGCTVCGYTGPKLKRHMRTHTGEKPYRCDRCGKKFTRVETLMNHAAIHIDDFPSHCRVCFHGFELKSEAIAHEKCCKKRRYECHICKKFVTCSKSQLITHMRMHNGDRPFRCEICMKHFGLKHHLKRHLNTIHTSA